MEDIEWIIMIIRGEQAISDLESTRDLIGLFTFEESSLTRSSIVF
jgi:hypothetical protein